MRTTTIFAQTHTSERTMSPTGLYVFFSKIKWTSFRCLCRPTVLITFSASLLTLWRPVVRVVQPVNYLILQQWWANNQESCAVVKMTAQCALYMGSLKIFGTPWLSQNVSWAFVPIDPMNVHTKFEVSSFTRSWDNRGYPKNFGSPWICPHSVFSKTFKGLYFGCILWLYLTLQRRDRKFTCENMIH